jgi:hypothetical protein
MVVTETKGCGCLPPHLQVLPAEAALDAVLAASCHVSSAAQRLHSKRQQQQQQEWTQRLRSAQHLVTFQKASDLIRHVH